jgi:hypothetical protein
VPIESGGFVEGVEITRRRDTNVPGPRAPLCFAGRRIDLFYRLARHRVAIKLVDRCAPELPELARVWFETGRSTQMSAMEAYLDSRQRAALLTLPGPTPIVARTIVELWVLWAVHCQFDPAPAARPQPSDDTLAAATAAVIARSTALDERHPS